MNQPSISGRRAALLVGICALAMLALVVLYAFAPELRGNQSDEANALSRSAVGFAGLKELLAASGIPATIDRGDNGDAKPSLTILTPAQDTDPNDLAAYRTQGPVLVILPKWQTIPLREHPGWVQKGDAVPVAVIDKQLAAAAPGIRLYRYPARPAKGAAIFAHADHVQVLRGRGRRVMNVAGYGTVVMAGPRSGGRLFILSEPDLLNNHALSDQRNANDALTLIRDLRAGNGPVAFDVTLTGLGKEPSLLRAAFAPPFLGATICALITALLMGLHTAIRFGAALVPPRIFARGKKALADNSAQLVRMMGREGAMAPRYVLAARTLVLERLGARRFAPQQQQALLDSLTRGGETYDQLAAQAATAKSGGDLLAVARKAFDWRRRISGGY